MTASMQIKHTGAPVSLHARAGMSLDVPSSMRSPNIGSGGFEAFMARQFGRSSKGGAAFEQQQQQQQPQQQVCGQLPQQPQRRLSTGHVPALAAASSALFEVPMVAPEHVWGCLWLR